MALSEVEICNTALSHIRGGGINSLTEGSIQAQRCALLYGPSRDECLQNGKWGFSRSIAALALLTDTIFGYAYVYQYPSDCLRINKLIINFTQVNQGDGAYRPRQMETLYSPDIGKQVPYKVFTVGGKKVIACNYPDLHMDYQTRVTDVSMFDPLFSSALSYLLASKLAVPIVGGQTGETYTKTQYALYERQIGDAAAMDMNEEYMSTPDSEMITAHL